ncbi:MAG: PD-(D/E)XK nuclease family protein, partial [Thermodesulfovibrionales bacterium]
SIGFIDEGFEEKLHKAVERVREETGAGPTVEETGSLISALLQNRELSQYFERIPGREIRREQEYVDSSGRLFRMDRVVIDPGTVTVMDYKTGRDKSALEKYRAQMGNYMRILRDVYPGKAVDAVIAFVDLNEVERLQ